MGGGWRVCAFVAMEWPLECLRSPDALANWPQAAIHDPQTTNHPDTREMGEGKCAPTPQPPPTASVTRCLTGCWCWLLAGAGADAGCWCWCCLLVLVLAELTAVVPYYVWCACEE
jgi:hypothetical protein